MKSALIACEFSGTLRDAFENAGWNAWSCDLLPTESEQTKKSGKHIQGDILKILKGSHCGIEVYGDVQKIIELNKWNLLIGFPPCDYTSFVYTGKERYSNDRLQKKLNAMQFFLDLWSAQIKHICLENPLGYIHTGLLPCSQIVEPYYWGDPYKKKTCLWLKNLPLLTHVKMDNLFEKKTVVEPTHLLVCGSSKKKKSKLPQLTKMFADKKQRSRFHRGIAKAMAEQWTEYINKENQ